MIKREKSLSEYIELVGSLEREKFTWLPRALGYFVKNRDYGVVDRLANATNPNVALTVLYDAMRVIQSIISSGKEEDFLRAFERGFGKVVKKEGKPYYCYKGEKCPNVCKTLDDECCCDAETLYNLVFKEVESLKHTIEKKFDVDVMVKLKVIALNALG